MRPSQLLHRQKQLQYVWTYLLVCAELTLLCLQPPAPRTNRLKRRADVLAERTTTAPAPIEIDIPEEPALKRYRQLFEGTGRAAASLSTIGENSAALAPTTTLAATGSSRKRKSSDRDQDGDADMEDATRPKRRVTSTSMSQQPDSGQNPSYTEPNLESSQSQSPTQPRILASSQAHTRSAGPRGAAPGAPDKDSALLDALAQHAKEDQGPSSKDAKSKNKGGKGATVDKEFSNMRIAEANDKEEASRRRAEEMRVWEECEHDINVRGNFMVVELVDLVRRNRGPATRSINPAWEGKPDFKKFKKVHCSFVRFSLSLTRWNAFNRRLPEPGVHVYRCTLMMRKNSIMEWGTVSFRRYSSF